MRNGAGQIRSLPHVKAKRRRDDPAAAPSPAAALNIEKGMGSPLNPIAIF
jgi:hypothetical protein